MPGEHQPLPLGRIAVLDAADLQEDAVGGRIAADEVRGHRERLSTGMDEIGFESIQHLGPRRPLRVRPGCEHPPAGDRCVCGSPGDERDGRDADHHRQAEQSVGEGRIDHVLEPNRRDPGLKIAHRSRGEGVPPARSARLEFHAARQPSGERGCDPLDSQCDVDQ